MDLDKKKCLPTQFNSIRKYLCDFMEARVEYLFPQMLHLTGAVSSLRAVLSPSRSMTMRLSLSEISTVSSLTILNRTSCSVKRTKSTWKNEWKKNDRTRIPFVKPFNSSTFFSKIFFASRIQKTDQVLHENPFCE